MEKIKAANGAAFSAGAGTFVVFPVDGEWLVGRGESMEDAFDAIGAYDGRVGEVTPYLDREEAIDFAMECAGEFCVDLARQGS